MANTIMISLIITPIPLVNYMYNTPPLTAVMFRLAITRMFHIVPFVIILFALKSTFASQYGQHNSHAAGIIIEIALHLILKLF